MKTNFATLLLIFFAGCTTNEPQVLTIAAAANMQYAINELRSDFEDRTKIKTQVIIGSSGKLSSQIMEGAPFDIFISADTLYPNYLYREGKTLTIPVIYAYGQLIIWSMKEEISWSEELLTRERIAIANPSLAPYGLAARQALEKLGDLKYIEKKLIYGESVAQTNQYIVSGAVDFGLTAYSVINSDQMRGKGWWAMVPSELYGAIPQAAVPINHPSTNQEEAQQFMVYLSSAEARSILEKFGYLVTSS